MPYDNIISRADVQPLIRVRVSRAMGGKPSKATPADKRLKENRGNSSPFAKGYPVKGKGK